MSEQLHNDMLAQIMGELAQLREKVASQEVEIARLKAAPTSPEVVSEGKSHHRSLTTSRRRLLGKLAAGALVAGVAGTTALAGQTAQAKVTSDSFPTASFTTIGAVVTTSSGSYTGTPPASVNFGLVATPVPSGTFDLSTLPSAGNVGAYGQSGAYGLYGKSTGAVNNAAGVYGIAATTSSTNTAYGVYGSSSGTGTNYGVYGVSTGVGVYGYGNTGGVVARLAAPGNDNLYALTAYTEGLALGGAISATSGSDNAIDATGANIGVNALGGNIGVYASGAIPLVLKPTSTPTSNLQKGAMYVDNSGNLFVYNGTAWKQVQYI